jgi:hypothetical protein
MMCRSIVDKIATGQDSNLELALYRHAQQECPFHFPVRCVSPSAVIVYLENIGFIYPAMSMMVIGPSLLYKDKVGGVFCMIFIDSK